MPLPEDWQNPITVAIGEIQNDIDARELLPSRPDLWEWRLKLQSRLIQANVPRFTLILVTSNGVIYDGHHAVRAYADLERTVEIQVIDAPVISIGRSILDLPLR